MRRWWRAPNFAPDPARDVLLVSYPRSGNTWLRAAIASLQLGRHITTLQELDFIVPDNYFQVKRRAMEELPFYVVKTHDPFTSSGILAKFKRAIYVVRDPRDVALSYYRYQNSLGLYSGTRTQFITDMFSGRILPCSWQEQVTSWSAAGGADSMPYMLLLRYEDIVRGTPDALGKIAHFLGLRCEDAWIEEVARSLSPEGMRKREEAGNRPGLENLRFVGEAKANNWTGKIEAEGLNVIATLAGNAMKLHGYE